MFFLYNFVFSYIAELSYFSFQTAILLLRIDDIVSGTKKQTDAMNPTSGGPSAPATEGPEA